MLTSHCSHLCGFSPGRDLKQKTKEDNIFHHQNGLIITDHTTIAMFNLGNNSFAAIIDEMFNPAPYLKRADKNDKTVDQCSQLFSAVPFS